MCTQIHSNPLSERLRAWQNESQSQIQPLHDLKYQAHLSIHGMTVIMPKSTLLCPPLLTPQPYFRGKKENNEALHNSFIQCYHNPTKSATYYDEVLESIACKLISCMLAPYL